MAGVEPSPVITVMASPSAGEDYPDEMQLDDPIPPERELAMRAATADAHPSPPITVSSDRPDDDPMELSLEDALGEICTNSGSPRDAPLQELTSGPHSVLDPSATDQMENIGPDGSSCMIPLVTPRATQPPIDVTLCERPTFLAVFDLDKTIVGDLETLSDRDNLETNIEWTFWPDGVKRGLTVDDIVPFMERGMLRPGFGRLVDNIVRLGGVIVIYTHSESKWASKVLEAVEIVIGRKFSYRLFPRSDCIDHNPHFRSKKSLLHIFSKLAFRWTRLDNVVMFEDDPNALCRSEATRLLHVPAYDYWEHCPWDENVTLDFLSLNPPLLARRVITAVRQWQIAPPSFGKIGKTDADESLDVQWFNARKAREETRLWRNETVVKDRVFERISGALEKFAELTQEDVANLPTTLRAAVASECS